MGRIPQGPQLDGQFWGMGLLLVSKLCTLQTSKVDTRIGEITFDW